MLIVFCAGYNVARYHRQTDPVTSHHIRAMGYLAQHLGLWWGIYWHPLISMLMLNINYHDIVVNHSAVKISIFQRSIIIKLHSTVWCWSSYSSMSNYNTVLDFDEFMQRRLNFIADTLEWRIIASSQWQVVIHNIDLPRYSFDNTEDWQMELYSLFTFKWCCCHGVHLWH